MPRDVILMIGQVGNLCPGGLMGNSGPQGTLSVFRGPQGAPGVFMPFGPENSAGPWVGSDVSP